LHKNKMCIILDYCNRIDFRRRVYISMEHCERQRENASQFKRNVFGVSKTASGV